MKSKGGSINMSMQSLRGGKIWMCGPQVFSAPKSKDSSTSTGHINNDRSLNPAQILRLNKIMCFRLWREWKKSRLVGRKISLLAMAQKGPRSSQEYSKVMLNNAPQCTIWRVDFQTFLGEGPQTPPRYNTVVMHLSITSKYMSRQHTHVTSTCTHDVQHAHDMWRVLSIFFFAPAQLWFSGSAPGLIVWMSEWMDWSM